MFLKEKDTAEMPANVALLEKLFMPFMFQAIYVAADLQLADHLKDGSKSVGELARVTQTDEAALYRVLRALSSMEIFNEGEKGIFELTPMAEWLISDVEGSLHSMVLMLGGQPMWNILPDLLTSVKTGESSFEKTFKLPFYEYLSQSENKKAGDIFNLAMYHNTQRQIEQILANYDFASYHKIIDVAGNHGQLLTAILKKNPDSKGIIFDQSYAREMALANLDKEQVSDRCEFVIGDFFKEITKGGDLYILKHILHNWNDDKAIEILKQCREAMGDSGKLLVIEPVIEEGNTRDMMKFLDLQMLLLLSGKERTQEEYSHLCEASGLFLHRVIQPSMGMSLLEIYRT
ncbi:methyltransferase [Brevibacillus laterosporus]|uniref:BogM n=1 Tax=Brevibacillus laterosporus TaxID=1465 RepID=A0A2H4R0V8_BRELA|nr:methyltransferase [Brevibacillus laterosporus]ATO50309.1 methyltransferase [Brevibacillus laterosporus DSM 25]ATY37600.1 BogM [Brevibacillus laterosporus]MBG9802972.1 methyltransferase [Brevibacillus laterosporus]MED4764148.1 methyltransferase [Brevibacillus laterosporus]PPA82412.1 methyltransferase [Brevibacillus laterosporus]